MKSILKKPKVETEELVVEDNRGAKDERDDEHEEALVALIEHRTKEVEHLKKKILYYKSQLEQTEQKLNDSKATLAKLRSRDNLVSSKKLLTNGNINMKVESKTSTSAHPDESHSHIQTQSKPQLIIPAVRPKIAQPVQFTEPNTRVSARSENRASTSFATNSNSNEKVKGDAIGRPSSELEVVESKGTKRKFEQKEHTELIPLIQSSESPCLLRCQSGLHISSQHKRKLRSLVLNPFNDQLFVTSALDGVVNLWQLQGKGSSASLLSSTDCISPKRRWPEDITWHPRGDSLFSVYTADGGDSQISILNLNATQEKKRVTFLEEKPHVKGIINSVNFMPWEDVCFATGGSDHAVVLCREKDGESSWKSKALHRNLHSSAVMGVAGLQHKQVILSAGADKRIIGFDLVTGRTYFKHQIENKCMSVLPNPSDFNLFMVQTGAPGKQLQLYDIRLRQTEIHEFGWKQESSESQSALINQAWSPDGLYISSGSADPMIHVFDIRFKGNKPSQSIKAHQKRVFKAVWQNSHPLLISISSDLNIGLHKIG
ncbi:U5 small nuclear ribonucleoprotein 40 kDa protein-like [Papaver somniferum]|uniref:U5 small nuclear ribonucleoprotein 40 kDa protein-like n=1 Tax=Papaver somniferum TaxID=3469 RepID=UPI000E6FE836|nr:U5 small nuclear ribonucleoprotein 40 kDa protein-like [Papaver somniferum]